MEVRSDRLHPDGPQKNMVLDFCRITALVRPLLESHLDHHHLNDTLKTDSPTSEFIARWVYDRLQPDLPELRAVTIHETCTCRCRYEGQ